MNTIENDTFDSKHHIIPEELIALLQKKGLQPVIDTLLDKSKNDIYNSEQHIQPEELLALLEKEGLQSVADKLSNISNNDIYNPKHHIKPEELLALLEKEGLQSVADKLSNTTQLPSNVSQDMLINANLLDFKFPQLNLDNQKPIIDSNLTEENIAQALLEQNKNAKSKVSELRDHFNPSVSDTNTIKKQN